MGSWPMFDSTQPYQIPQGARVVAPYRNGLYAWSAAQLDYHAAAAKAFIDVLAADAPGCAVLDVERYDARPQDAPGWLRQKPAGSGCIYCSSDTLPAVTAQCAGLAYFIWLATLDGTVCLTGADLDLPPGVTLAAVQGWPQALLGFPADLSVILSADWLIRIGGSP